MKKLIAIAVVFALAVGTAFAVDLGAEVITHAKLFAYEGSGSGVKASGGWDRLRISGAGELMDGKFGGKIRIDPAEWKQTTETWNPAYDPTEANASKYALNNGVQGYAYWKPIDQFKLIIGQSGASDGFWGKEGQSGWSFNQTANDFIVPSGSTGNIWGGGYTDLKYRKAFADDYVDAGIYMEIRPMDMLGINIGLPVFSGDKWDKGLFKKVLFQVDLNFAFGNIAITYKDNSVFLYFGGSFGAIGLDIGLSVPQLIDNPGFTHLYFGAALKFSAGAFGLKFRTAAGIPVKSGASFDLIAGVLPSFAINDNFSVFVNVESGFSINSGLAKMGFSFNPYIRIGAEWGPTFYAGIQVEKKSKTADVTFGLPIGIEVSF